MTRVFKNSFQVPNKVLHYFTDSIQAVDVHGYVEEVKLVIRGQTYQILQKQEKESAPVYVKDKLYVTNMNRVYEVRGSELHFVIQLNTSNQVQIANFQNQLLLTDTIHFYLLEDGVLKRKKFCFDGSQLRFSRIQLFSFDNSQQIHTLALITENERQLLFRLDDECELLYCGKMQLLISEAGLTACSLNTADVVLVDMTLEKLRPQVKLNQKKLKQVETNFGRQFSRNDSENLVGTAFTQRQQCICKTLVQSAKKYPLKTNKVPFSLFHIERAPLLLKMQKQFKGIQLQSVPISTRRPVDMPNFHPNPFEQEEQARPPLHLVNPPPPPQQRNQLPPPIGIIPPPPQQRPQLPPPPIGVPRPPVGLFPPPPPPQQQRPQLLPPQQGMPPPPGMALPPPRNEVFDFDFGPAQNNPVFRAQSPVAVPQLNIAGNRPPVRQNSFGPQQPPLVQHGVPPHIQPNQVQRRNSGQFQAPRIQQPQQQPAPQFNNIVRRNSRQGIEAIRNDPFERSELDSNYSDYSGYFADSDGFD